MTAAADPLDRHIGMRLRQLRKRKRINMEQAAELIDVSQQQISRFELGRNRLSASQLYRLARGLDVPVAWFYETFEERNDELERIRNVVREPRSEWRPGSENEEVLLLIEHWRGLHNTEQRRKVIELLAAFSGH